LFSRRKRRYGYRHIKVKDRIDTKRKLRIVTVTCPLEYPGLTPSERRKMYEGLGLVADAFRDADARCARTSK
jgi:hypothetical protein